MNESFQILPTHTCFDDVMEWLALHGRRMELDKLMAHTFVHGICKGFDIGIHAAHDAPYAHAWILRDDVVIDFGIHSVQKVVLMMEIPKTVFYHSRKVQQEVHYTPKEYALASNITGHSGPWKAAMERLTADNHGRRPRIPPSIARMGKTVSYTDTTII